MTDDRSGHARVNARLDDFLDGELSAEARREMEAHLETCARCRADLAARRELLGEVAALPGRVEPARDLWPDLRSRMEGGHGDARARPRRASRPALAAAAAVLFVAGAATLALWFSGGGQAGGAPDTGSVTFVADWRALEGEYVGAAEELQQTLDEIGGELAPETRRIVEENLRVIDEAIAESRAALERDPANRQLEQALRAAWSSKVEMLQYVTRL